MSEPSRIPSYLNRHRSPSLPQSFSLFAHDSLPRLRSRATSWFLLLMVPAIGVPMPYCFRSRFSLPSSQGISSPFALAPRAFHMMRLAVYAMWGVLLRLWLIPDVPKQFLLATLFLHPPLLLPSFSTFCRRSGEFSSARRLFLQAYPASSPLKIPEARNSPPPGLVYRGPRVTYLQTLLGNTLPSRLNF